MMKRNWKRSGGGGRRPTAPSREWVPLTGTPFAGVTATTATSLFGLEAPTITLGTSLTADAPEDLTIMRMVAEFGVSLTSGAAARWVVGLLVQDRTWTPGATFSTDADKRFLWYRTFGTSTGTGLPAGLASLQWMPGLFQVDATVDTVVPDERSSTTVDITPRVKLETGKALHMVAYEEIGTATFQLDLFTCRLLVQRSRRR